jgi:hypothetical protein
MGYITVRPKHTEQCTLWLADYSPRETLADEYDTRASTQP